MLPLSVIDFQSFLPHRPPAVWMHEVVSVDETSGSCSVSYSRSAPFAVGDSILQSTYIEWMAQAFGYVTAAQRKLGILKSQADLQDAFLAAFKNYQIFEVPSGLKDGDIFIVSVKATHVVGPVTLVEGRIEKDSQLMASAQLKLFAVPKS